VGTVDGGLSRGAVLGEILASGPTTRVRLSSATELSTATVTRTVSGLIAERIAAEIETLPSTGRGRRAVLLDVLAEAPVAMGIDLGATHTRITTVALTGRPIDEAVLRTPSDAPARELAAWLSAAAADVAGRHWPVIECVAVGLTGVVHPVTAHVSLSSRLRQIEGAGFVETLQRALDRPLLADNDANFALQSEMYSGAAAGFSSAVMFTLDVGLGAGVAIDGRIYRGSRGIVGEYGSLPLAGDGGPLEEYLTTTGILRLAEAAGAAIRAPEDIFAETRDEAILGVCAQFENALVVAITAAVVSIDPAVIVLGGRLGPLLGEMVERLGRRVADSVGSEPRIRLAEQSDLSGAHGASVRGLHFVLTGMGVPESYLSRIPRAAVVSGPATSGETGPTPDREPASARGQAGPG
jgi:predicted NBD/HSP70 family sugar kinase